MGVDGTTVSRRLRRLEMRIGQILFEQTHMGQVLTEAGEALLLKVEAMASAAVAIDEGAHDNTASTLSGTLRISASEGFGTWFLAPQLEQFASAHPALTVDLVASSGFLSPSKREADIAVMLSRPRAGPVLAKKLTDYSLGLYATEKYLEAKGVPQVIENLADGHTLIGYIPDLVYAPELRYLDELLPGLSPKLRSSSISAQLQLIASGAGIGVLPCFMAATDRSLVPLLKCYQVKRAFWLVTHKDTQQLARIREGKKWIHGCLEKRRYSMNP